MGLMSGLMGNASKVEVEGVVQEYGTLLGTGEEMQHAYKLTRDVIIFTNRRLILIDKQGMTGKKIEYLSVPYKSIRLFAVETSGTFDLDAELKIWTSGTDGVIEKQFSKGANIYEVQALLAEYVCGE
jgi:hypothetical protein